MNAIDFPKVETRVAPIARCPICNAGVGEVTSGGTDYLCGARVTPSIHGSWTLSLPCPVVS